MVPGKLATDPQEKVYYIKDIYYPKHSEMHGATCEISTEGENDLMMWLVEHGKEADIDKMKLWGHSHHTMGVNPSGQDETQALARMKNTGSYVIRLICNKSGEISLSFFDPVAGVRFDNVGWEIKDDTPEDIAQNKIQQILTVINNADIKIDGKLTLIASIVYRDEQMSKITERVKTLKELNIPKVATTYTPPWQQNQTYERHNYGRVPNGPVGPESIQQDAFDDIGGAYGGRFIPGFDDTPGQPGYIVEGADPLDDVNLAAMAAKHFGGSANFDYRSSGKRGRKGRRG